MITFQAIRFKKSQNHRLRVQKTGVTPVFNKYAFTGGQ
ncbi:hypothetical protein PANA5342_1026 [Pantoea ananatis LMG 5342]|nr:hypothetical protein PANA5342_1026 [Pantoea ananatis LMG 5342]